MLKNEAPQALVQGSLERNTEPRPTAGRTYELKLFIFCGLSLFSILSFGIYHSSFSQEAPGYDPKGKRNPFVPLVTSDGRLLKLEQQDTSKNDLVLEGIIYDKNGTSFAMINGEVVKESEMAGDYQVIKIEDARVVLLKDGQALEIGLNNTPP